MNRWAALILYGLAVIAVVVAGAIVISQVVHDRTVAVIVGMVWGATIGNLAAWLAVTLFDEER